MVELLVARKRDSNLIFRNLNKKKDRWDPTDFGSSGKDQNFEAVIKNKDATILAYLLLDLQRIGYPIEKAIAKFKEISSDPTLFFLH